MAIQDHALLGEAFASVCRERGDRHAVLGEGPPLSYDSLYHEALRFAARARRSEGPNVGLLFPTCGAFIPAYFGTLLGGRVPVPLNFLLPAHELAEILADASVRMIFLHRLFRERIALPQLDLVCAEELSGGAAEAGTARAEPGDPATLLYTSGSTARPKGVVLTHRNLLSNAAACAREMGVIGEDRFLGVLPLFHAFALTCNMLLPVLSGAAVYYQSRFHPAALVEAAARERITLINAVPSLFRALLRPWKESAVPLGSIRAAVAGGEPLPDELRESFASVSGIPLLDGYGLTECSPVVALNTPSTARAGTVGRPLKELDVRIAAGDGGEEAGPGVEGEILVRGPCVMKGYHNRPEETAGALLPGGWLRTGDLGMLDGEGFLRVTGRLKELIISGGENISPSRIEEALSRHPAVSEAAVIGVPDPLRGEAPKAFVVLHPSLPADAAELRAWCSRNLARSSVPREIAILPELPRTFTGKVNKRALRERGPAGAGGCSAT
jgi:long-chain acyl-CoA synthetase